MAKRKKSDGGGGGGAPAWMCTFSDLMNLLLCFFVLLFSMSSVDAEKWEQVVASMTNAFSIFTAGSTTIGNGSLVGIGTSQLSDLDENFNSTGQTSVELGEDERDAANAETKNPDSQIGGKTTDNQQDSSAAQDQQNTGGQKQDPEIGGKTPEDSQSADDKDKNPGDRDQNKDKDKDKDKDQDAAQDQQDAAGKKDDADKTAGQTEQTDDSGKKKEEDVGGKTKEEEDGGQTLIDKLAALGKAETEEMLDNIAEMTERYSISDMLEITMDNAGKYVEITLSGSMLFDSGSADLQTSCLPLLSKIGDILKVYSTHDVDIIGHTDNVPIKSAKFADNDILSSARAISAAQYLVKEKGIDVKRLSWTGRGEYEPVASNATAEGRARNRRIEIRIYNSYNSNN